jgi:hypothetical protein
MSLNLVIKVQKAKFKTLGEGLIIYHRLQIKIVEDPLQALFQQFLIAIAITMNTCKTIQEASIKE